MYMHLTDSVEISVRGQMLCVCAYVGSETLNIQSKYGLIACQHCLAQLERERVIVNAQAFRALPRSHDRKSLCLSVSFYSSSELTLCYMLLFVTGKLVF